MIALFLFCFIIIHLFRWAANYYLETKARPIKEQSKEKAAQSNDAKNTPPQQTEPSKTSPKQKPPETVYYIVERKKRAKKPPSAYSEPKEIRFK